jgi:hypothetical protein
MKRKFYCEHYNEKNIVDFTENKKTFEFKDYFKFTDQEHDDPDEIYLVRNIPLDFISVNIPFFYLQVDEYKNGIAILHRSKKAYYFKLNKDLVRFITWPTESSLDSVKQLETIDKKFSTILQKLRSCVDLKDVDCLISFNKSFLSGIYEWSVFNDASLCNLHMQSGRGRVSSELSNRIKKKIVNWDLYKKLFALNDSNIKVRLVHKNFADGVDLEISLKGDKACERQSSIILIFTREKLGSDWEISVYPSAAAG